MLLLNQVGSVKIGEVVRYTVTYTPSHDRILPSPEFLYLRIRNTCAIALRAAFVHGPYTLSVAAYPSNFNPNEKFLNPRRYGVPEFEPMLKAGGSWTCHLVVPDDIRQSAGTGSHGYFGNGPEHDNESVTWVIEVASQVIFSASAGVNYEICLARDEKSLNLSSGIPVVGNQAQVPQPGRVSDFQQSVGAKDGHHPAQPKGVFSRAVHVKVEDTAALWNTPELPGWDEGSKQTSAPHGAGAAVQTAPEARKSKEDSRAPKKQKNVHLVVLTHGLHSNLGADMLFLKESIDAGVKQAKIDAKARRAKEQAAGQQKDPDNHAGQAGHDSTAKDQPSTELNDDEDEDEEVIVRGFAGNATRTERGIKYLGKRLARYILSMTYPDQPFLPAVKVASDAFSRVMHDQAAEGKPAHKHSTIHKAPRDGAVHSCSRAYKITKISFIAHSLGGLVQTYAIAYIQKHSPQFFDLIKPINFIALASPFLGLNHENPMYVSFALDFGLVGRTGQDLGLTWRAPTIARNGWGALVSSLGENAHKRVMGEVQPESKPLLRILPTGPAHIALKKFRNRTVYSNVVNDGIVPLRTSCLLFLDWQGLGRVEKARREAGLVETVVGFGWAELTGANVTSPRPSPWTPSEDNHAEIDTGTTTPTGHEDSHEVPQPATDATLEDDRQSLRAVTTSYKKNPESQEGGSSQDPNSTASTNNSANPFSGIFNFFRNNDSPKTPPPPSQKQKKIYQRSQTLPMEDNSSGNNSSSKVSKVTSGHELSEDSDSGLSAPPRTTFFESAGDLLNPKLPSIEYLIDPSKRPRTIFHDRVYHPSDIPPPPLKKRPTGSLAIRRRSYARTTSSSSKKTDDSGASSPYPSPGINHEDSIASARDYDDTSNTNPDKDPDEVIDTSSMKVEEKIARAYHKGLSWRKVLVKLEPDAHNNLIVRRMFANAFGWPVVKHLVDAHFSDSAAARTRDDEETNTERARDINEPPDSTGSETRAQTEGKPETKQSEHPASDTTHTENMLRPKTTEEQRTASEDREAEDKVPDLPVTPRADSEDKQLHSSQSPHLSSRPNHERLDSMTWSDRDWADSADESEIEENLAYGRKSQEEEEGPRRGSPVDKGKAPERSSSPLSNAWENWTEKIVGKGAGSRAKSPMSPTGRSVSEDNA